MATLDELLSRDAKPEADDPFHGDAYFDINKWVSEFELDLSGFQQAIEELDDVLKTLEPTFLAISDSPFLATDAIEWKVQFSPTMLYSRDGITWNGMLTLNA